MPQNNKPDFDNAQAALSRALESIQHRIESIDDEIAKLNQQRKAYLNSTVEALLPKISGKTLRSLQDVIPAFLTRDVLAVFERNWTVLGFHSETYNRDYEMLQTRLAGYLDQRQFGKLKAMDEENAGKMASLIADKGALNQQAEKAIDLLDVMQKAKKANIKIPLAAAAQIRNIASVGRASAAPTGGAPRPVAQVGASGATTSSRLTSTASSSTDDSDLWFYFMTDIPTSFRTLMIESITEDRVREQVAERAASIDTGSSGSGWESSCDTPAPPNTDAAAFAAAECTAISTDDSLGLFS